MDTLDLIGRILSILSIPLVVLTIWGLIRQVRKEQRISRSTPIIGLVMAPLTLLVNLIFLHQAFPEALGAAFLIFGLGFGLAWGQTSRFSNKQGVITAKRSILHLIFWGISYGLTQILALFAPASIVAGGLASMFFSTGATLGTNLNMLVRMARLRARANVENRDHYESILLKIGLPEQEPHK